VLLVVVVVGSVEGSSVIVVVGSVEGSRCNSCSK